MQQRPCRTYTDSLSDEGVAHDQHYTVAELAKLWHMSPNTVRRLMADEPGVLKFTSGLKHNSRCRSMTQLRIPDRVAQRVHARLSS